MPLMVGGAKRSKETDENCCNRINENKIETERMEGKRWRSEGIGPVYCLVNNAYTGCFQLHCADTQESPVAKCALCTTEVSAYVHCVVVRR